MSGLPDEAVEAMARVAYERAYSPLECESWESWSERQPGPADRFRASMLAIAHDLFAVLDQRRSELVERHRKAMREALGIIDTDDSELGRQDAASVLRDALYPPDEEAMSVCSKCSCKRFNSAAPHPDNDPNV